MYKLLHIQGNGKEKENLILDLYYNQNKTYREITEIAGEYEIYCRKDI
jgi:DNA-directed RNA polymerase specialized sigma subunit